MILHICNDFSYTKVHHNLYKELDALGYKQQIFNPLQKLENKGKNEILFKSKNSRIIYSSLLKPYHRFLFRRKINFLSQDLKEKIEITNIKMVHATTLYSDGTLAYELFKKYKIPYIVAIRNTDIEVFLKYRPDLIFLGIKILTNSRKIIFISQSSFQAFQNHYLISEAFLKKIKNKIEIIPNGIDHYWITNKKTPKVIKPTNFLYVGSFEKRKNLQRLIKAFEKLQIFHPDIKLSIVGGGGGDKEENEKILELINLNQKINFLGFVKDKGTLQKIYSNHDIFTMVSYRETFGLVYLEALSQGLPILYSKGQGVSGEFNFPVGEEVNPVSEEDIFRGISKLLENYDNYKLYKIDFSKYSWINIALKYSKIYKDSITC